MSADTQQVSGVPGERERQPCGHDLSEVESTDEGTSHCAACEREARPEGAGAERRDPFAKDCGCVTHEGPHWLHMDEMDRERARELAAAGNYHGAVHLEVIRLGEKLREMERRGIAEIPAEVVERVRASREHYRAERRREVARKARADRASAETRLTEAAAEYELATAETRESLRAEIDALQQQLRSSEAA